MKLQSIILIQMKIGHDLKWISGKNVITASSRNIWLHWSNNKICLHICDLQATITKLKGQGNGKKILLWNLFFFQKQIHFLYLIEIWFYKKGRFYVIKKQLFNNFVWGCKDAFFNCKMRTFFLVSLTSKFLQKCQTVNRHPSAHFVLRSPPPFV